MAFEPRRAISGVLERYVVAVLSLVYVIDAFFEGAHSLLHRSRFARVQCHCGSGAAHSGEVTLGGSQFGAV